MLSLPNRANVQTCLKKTRNNHEDSGGKKHVSSNQAHVVSSNQPIQKRFNVANPGLTKPGFSGDSADLLDDQRVLLSKFFVIGPKNHAIYIYYIICIYIYHISHEYLVAGLEHLDYFFPFSCECHHPN